MRICVGHANRCDKESVSNPAGSPDLGVGRGEGHSLLLLMEEVHLPGAACAAVRGQGGRHNRLGGVRASLPGKSFKHTAMPPAAARATPGLLLSTSTKGSVKCCPLAH